MNFDEMSEDAVCSAQVTGILLRSNPQQNKWADATARV